MGWTLMVSRDIVLTWKSSPAKMADSVDAFKGWLLANLMKELTLVAQKIEHWAKSFHAWRNRTGRAEAGMYCVVQWTGTGFKLTLSHTMDYGVYLEFRWGGKWGVIRPALSASFGDVMTALVRALGG